MNSDFFFDTGDNENLSLIKPLSPEPSISSADKLASVSLQQRGEKFGSFNTLSVTITKTHLHCYNVSEDSSDKTYFGSL